MSFIGNFRASLPDFEGAFESLPVAAFLVNDAGVVLAANGAARDRMQPRHAPCRDAGPRLSEVFEGEDAAIVGTAAARTPMDLTYRGGKPARFAVSTLGHGDEARQFLFVETGRS
ncbi:PAS domain-containing protein [Rhodobacterales bacterium HKCCE2091]|nr:PAS domain-containing protein [Rhodobacterales bacterium HKCCE2091]